MPTTMDNFERLLPAAIKGEAQELEQLSAEDFCSKVLAQESRLRPGPSSLLSTTNNDGETPLLVAVKSGRDSLALDLLEQHYSRHELLVEHLLRQDTDGCNVLHHAIRNGYKDLALKLIHQKPALSECRNERLESPMFIAVLKGFRSIYMALLRNERSEYGGAMGYNALHAAVKYGNQDFVEQLVDMHPEMADDLARQTDTQQDTPVHLTAHFNRDKILTLMLRRDRSLGYLVHVHEHVHENVRVRYSTPLLYIAANWNKICCLILNSDRRAEADIYNLQEEIRNKVIAATRKDTKSLIQTYTSNTSLVAILLATITFAAAFTLPGGYSSDAGSEGLPIMARKVAFQAFLVFDTSAMCASLAVAFICVIARWMDFEFLLHYRFVTTKLMWFAYMATTLAFATGLYTVLEDRLPWLAIAICVLSVLLPVLTMLIGEWPILKLRIRYCKVLKSDFIQMV